MFMLLLSLLVIVLMTLYLVTQGTLTSLLVLATSFFASVLAIGVYEILAPLMGTWHPEYSHTVMFLGTFLLAFLLLRFLADYVAPRNVVLPIPVDRAIAAPIGLLASLVIVGTLITGLEMLPITGPILGDGGVTASGQPAHRNFAASFVNALYYASSGRGFGGAPLASTHPDLGAELTGIRHSVQLGSRQYLPADLVKVTAWKMATDEDEKTFGIPSALGPHKTVFIRTTVDQGSDKSGVSFDATDHGEQLMLTPTQVRLVAEGANDTYDQYFPVGYLDSGRTFVKLDPATGYVVDDYVDRTVISDWVFSIQPDQTPKLIELKAAGRAALGQPVKQMPMLAAAKYPKQDWLKSAGDLTVTIAANGHGMAGADVYLISPSATKDQLGTMVRDAYSRLVKIDDEAAAQQNGWGRVRTTTSTWEGREFGYVSRRLLPITNAGSEFRVDWDQIFYPVLLSRMGQEGAGNVLAADQCFTDVLLPALNDAHSVLTHQVANGQGKASLELPTGSYLVVVRSREPSAFRLWVQKISRKPGEGKQQSLDMSNQKPEFSVIVQSNSK